MALVLDGEGRWCRRMEVRKLAEVLADLPDDATVELNAVGNLLVHVPDRDLGYIDLNSESYHPFLLADGPLLLPGSPS